MSDVGVRFGDRVREWVSTCVTMCKPVWESVYVSGCLCASVCVGVGLCVRGERFCAFRVWECVRVCLRVGRVCACARVWLVGERA